MSIDISKLSLVEGAIHCYKQCLKHAFSFSGKTTRKEYWLAALCGFVIGILLALLEGILLHLGLFMFFGLLYAGMFIYSIFMGIAGVSMMARRCNDAGVSKWWLLSAFLSIIPIIGVIAFFIIWISIACKPSKVQA